MNKTIKRIFKGVLFAGAMSVPLGAAWAQIVVTVGFPTPEFVATSTPFVYEGHASYYYGGHWYYRDGNAWRYYHDEPSGLRDHRMHGGPARHMYGRGHGGGYRGR